MLAFFVVLLAFASTSSTLASSPKSDVTNVKDSFLEKFPELVHWYERAAERVHQNATASPADLNEIRKVLQDGKQKVYDFVTSPLYDLFGSMVIERAVNFASPLLGVLPLKEFREFMKIVSKKPELLKLVFSDPQEAESIVKILPTAAIFDQWLTNSTKKIVDEVVDSATSVDDEEVGGDFDILGSGLLNDTPGAPGAPGGSPGAPGGSPGAPGGSPGAPGGSPGAPGARFLSY